jgi:hypothetical protein
MIEPTSLSAKGSEIQKLKIKIPNWAWNAYEPQNHFHIDIVTKSTTSNDPRLLETKVDDFQLGKITTQALDDTNPDFPTTNPKSCKVKLWKFHHGGPKRVTKGTQQHDITYETPCLLPTCESCCEWHSQLIQIPTLPASSLETGHRAQNFE